MVVETLMPYLVVNYYGFKLQIYSDKIKSPGFKLINTPLYML